MLFRSLRRHLLIALGEALIARAVGHAVVAVERVLDVGDIARAVVGVEPREALGVGPFFQAAAAVVFVGGGKAW